MIVISARPGEAQKVALLDAGADDYLVKPFSLAEVALRVLALHRRASGQVVADVLAAVIESPATVGRTYEFVAGGTPIAEAVTVFASSGLSVIFTPAFSKPRTVRATFSTLP